MDDLDRTSLTDIHNHLVPGVDDGARTMDDVLRAVEVMTRQGIRKIVTTPHLDGSLTADPSALAERLDEVSEAWEEAAVAVERHFPEVQFRRGHEVMLDAPDVTFEDERMRLAGTSFVLVEWPRLHLPPGTAQVLKRIRSDGYRPVVAHPERYIGLDPALELVGQWREAGAYVQVSYGSLEGRFGADARRTAFRLLRLGWVDYFASDFHGRPDRKLFKQEAWEALDRIGASECFVSLSVTNPGRILRNEEPLPVPMLPPERSFWSRVKELLSAH